MTIKLANIANKIQPSATLSLNAKAAELKTNGRDIISLSVGEPDFDTPHHIKEAAIKAINDGKTRYTPVDGVKELKQAICDKFQRDNNLQYNPGQILVSCGAKHSLFNICHALLNPGDEAIIPAPFWVSYPDIVKTADALPKIISTDIRAQYKINATQLNAAITSKTKLLILNSPSNPSGISYSPTELQQLAAVLLKHPHVYIISDDIYEHILWSQNSFTNILNICPELYARTIIVNGVSKAYAMTGWRIGFMAGNPEIIAACKKIQSQSTSCPCSIAQYASIAALNGPGDTINAMVTEFKKRHDFIFELLQRIENLDVIPSHGTFYSFPDFSKIISQKQKIQNDLALSEYLLDTAGIAVVPGSAFGYPGGLRFSFAVNMDTIEKSVIRIKNAIDQLD
jgi:aspartate aminotransferase